MPRLFLAAAALMLLVTGSAAPAAAPPDIIVVLIDDMGWGDFSVFGNREARTTHIDRLAAEGRRFESFYVNAPICSPSRAAILTGQYPHRWRIGSYLGNRRLNESRGIAQWLDPAAPTLQRAADAAGHFGKWHLGGHITWHDTAAP
jgi:arylsulfatase A-like enzyme